MIVLCFGAKPHHFFIFADEAKTLNTFRHGKNEKIGDSFCVSSLQFHLFDDSALCFGFILSSAHSLPTHRSHVCANLNGSLCDVNGSQWISTMASYVCALCAAACHTNINSKSFLDFSNAFGYFCRCFEICAVNDFSVFLRLM